jgi:hypothetical protein
MMDRLADSAATDRLILERMRYATRQRVDLGRFSRDSMEMDVWKEIDGARRRAIVDLRTEVLARRVGQEEVTFHLDVPATWWDAFKAEQGERWLGRWWMRRHPARMTRVEHRVTFERWFKYPHADVPVPDPVLGRAVLYDRPLAHQDRPSSGGPKWEEGR